MDEAPDLVAAARRGDAGALERLIAQNQARIYRFGMKMCRDPEDAQDVLQETLLAMARGIRDFRGASSLSTWLYTIARSFCIKKRRRTSSVAATEQRALDDVDEPVSTQPDPEANAAQRELGAALDAAIGALEPKYREVLLLRDVEGLTAAEVAEVLGISQEAVKSRLHRARLSVRAALAPVLDEGGATAQLPKAPGTCPDVLRLFSRHVEDEISADQCAEMERHLEACPRCRGACASLKQSLALCRAQPALPVPEDVQNAVRGALRKLGEPRT